MSYKSLARQSTDQALRERVNSCAQEEARNNPNVSDTAIAFNITHSYMAAGDTFIWNVAIATEAEYEYAINAGNLDPGGDETVITDPMILGAVQASDWGPKVDDV